MRALCVSEVNIISGGVDNTGSTGGLGASIVGAGFALGVSGAELGGSLGSIAGPGGTVVGGLIGAAAGSLIGGVLGGLAYLEAH